MIENAGVLAARDLGDRLPAQDAGAEQIEIRFALVQGAQPGALAAQILGGNGAQGVGFGRPLFLALALLGGAGSRPFLALAWRNALVASSRAAARDSGVSSSGVVSDSATPRSVRHGPRVSLRCSPLIAIANDEGLLARDGNTTTRSPRQPRIGDLVALRAGLQVGNRDRGEGLGHGVSPGYRLKVVCT